MDVSGGGQAQEINGGTGYSLKFKVLTLPGWDMDATATIDVAHGLDYEKILCVKGRIRNDVGGFWYNLPYWDGSGNLGLRMLIKSSEIEITRNGGGAFDNSNFDNDTFSRGDLIIIYYS